MADQIFMPRALDANGDPVSLAEAYFYTTGTTTPVSVYADQGLTVLHSVPLQSDAAGAFEQVFVGTGTAVKVDVTDSLGASIPGYPVDPAPVMSIAGSAASSVTFSPITGNATTNVQAAIAVNTNRHEGRTADVKTFLTSTTQAEMRNAMSLGTMAITNAASYVRDQSTWNTGTSTIESTIAPDKLQAKLDNYTTKTTATNGSVKIGALIINWGQRSGTGAVTFNTAFPNAFFVAVTTQEQNAGGNVESTYHTPTTSGMQVVDYSGGTRLISYIAIGY